MKKILLIENSQIIIKMLSTLLIKDGDFEVIVEKDIEILKKLIEKEKFFAAISCLELEKSDATEHLELLKQNDIPTILLTGKENENMIKSIQNMGVVDYYFKENFYNFRKTYNLLKNFSFMKSSNVLIIDESKTIQKQISDTLKDMYINSTCCSSAEEGLEIIKGKPFDLILCDSKMHGIDGLRFIKTLKKDFKTSIIPVFIISGENDPYLRIKLYKNGIDDFLLKPFVHDELKMKIMNLFKKKKEQNELEEYTKLIDENIITSKTDEKGKITYASEAFCKISGYTKEELIGQNHNIVRHSDMPSQIYKDMWETIRRGETFSAEIKNKRKDGTDYWVDATIQPLQDEENKYNSFFAIRQDITDKKKIYEMSITDSLTKLYNRHYFNETAENKIETARVQNQYFGFLLLDIDNFKKYNDTYGHQLGDDVLEKVAASLQETFRRGEDIIYRLGGEEFGVVMSAPTKEDIIKLSEMARLKIQLLKIEHEKNEDYGVLTASFGLSFSDEENNHSIDDFYKHADELLYEAKENGRNTIKFN